MKKIKYLLIALLLVLLVGCGKSESKEIKTKSLNGEEIKITVDTSDKIDLKEDRGSYLVNKDGKEIAKVIFVTKENYDSVSEIFDRLTVIDKGTKDGNEYIFYSTTDQYNYLFMVKGTESGVSISSSKEENSKEAFNHLTFSK